MARRTQYAYLRSIARELVLLGLAIAVVLGTMVWLIPNDFLRGLVVGSVVVGVSLSVWSFVILATGTAPKMMGDLGEQWTATELRKLRRAGWLTVNHVLLVGSKDIDHVVVGPGGVIAVETKWTATAWTGLTDDRVRVAATSVREHAVRLSNWTELKTLGMGRATPVLFLWGTGARDLPAVSDLDGVTVVAGPHAREWRQRQLSRGVTPEQVNGAWDALERQCRVRDGRSGESIPPSPTEWLFRLFVAVVAGCASFLLIAESIGVSHSLWVGAACLVVAIVGGVVALRWPATRLAATGWLTGAAGVLVFGFVAALLVGGRFY